MLAPAWAHAVSALVLLPLLLLLPQAAAASLGDSFARERGGGDQRVADGALFGDKLGLASGLGPASNPISELDIHALELGLMESAMGGDLMGGLRKMLYGFQELQDLWADARVFRAVVEGMPLLRALKGVDALAAKAEGDITEADARQAAALFRGFLFKAMDAIDRVRDPDQYAATMLSYATTRDPEVLSLLQRIEQGDREANVEFQKLVINRELGDVIDLDMFGISGVEPEFMKASRAKAMQDEEFGFWDKLLDDPMARRYMEDPLRAYREWEEYGSR